MIDEARLTAWAGAALGATTVSLRALQPLGGGAIQCNARVDLLVDGRAKSVLLRHDPAAAIGTSASKAREYATLRLMERHGVAAPRPIAVTEDPAICGGAALLTEFLPGTALAHRVVRDRTLGGDRRRLLYQLGTELARLHGIPASDETRRLWGAPSEDSVATQLDGLCRMMQLAGATARPALAWGLRWALRNRPASLPARLCHGDFRTGNFLVDGQGLVGLLDWEFAGWGDPASDLGWFCAQCWRFGRPDLEAGGIGARDDLYRGYVDGGGALPGPERIAYWETVAHLRWAAIALDQEKRACREPERALELRLTGQMVPELELTIIRSTAPEKWR